MPTKPSQTNVWIYFSITWLSISLTYKSSPHCLPPFIITIYHHHLSVVLPSIGTKYHFCFPLIRSGSLLFCDPFIDFFSYHFGIVDGTTDDNLSDNRIIGPFFLSQEEEGERMVEKSISYDQQKEKEGGELISYHHMEKKGEGREESI